MKLGEPYLTKRGTKAREIIGVETEQPLEFDLQRVVDVMKELGSPPPYRSDYEFLLGLAGPEYFEQLGPNSKETVAELNESLETTSMGGTAPGRSKLFDPGSFARKGWDGQQLRAYMDMQLIVFAVLPNESWLKAVQLLVLFPEERQRILNRLRPLEASRLSWIVSDAREKPGETMAWRELSALRLVDPENTDVERVARSWWGAWNRRLEELLSKAKSASSSENQKKGSADAALGLYILAAEKAVINDQGLPEIIPAKKGMPHGPELPERPLT